MRRVLAAAMVLSASIPLSGRAAHEAQCTGTLTAARPTRRCDLVLRGLPIRIFGEAEVPSGGMARIHVEVMINTPDGLKLIYECSAERARYASCSGQAGPVTLDAYAGVVPLVCRGTATGAGAFACDSISCPEPDPLKVPDCYVP